MTFKSTVSIFFVTIFCAQLAFAKQKKQAVDEDAEDYAKLTYDLGVSFGSYNNSSYSEANLGLNYFLKQWLAWRNAVFGRFSTINNYGLDTSVRALYIPQKDGGFRVSAFAGPGYRISTSAQSGPFAEAGVTFHVAGISLGGGAKFLSYPNSGALPNSDVEIFIILSGSGAL